MKAVILPITAVDEAWPFIGPKIHTCLLKNNGDCSAGDLWTICRSGAGFLMVYGDETEIKAAAIWRFENWLSGTVLRNLITVGNDMEEWFTSFNDLAREKARQGGAEHFVFDGRKGWARVFPDAEIIKTTYKMKV